jgi:hypothetical protein
MVFNARVIWVASLYLYVWVFSFIETIHPMYML